MSVKNSSEKVFWVYSEDHRGYVLPSGGRNSVSINKHDTTHKPFISVDGVLTSQVVISRGDEPSLPCSAREGIVQLHPSTMELCGMRLGGPISLTSCPKQQHISAFRIWPSLSLPPGKVAISKDSSKLLCVGEDEFVSVRDLSKTCTDADAIVVSCDKSNIMGLNLSHLGEFLSKKLDKNYFIQGQIMQIQYFGRSLLLSVKCDELHRNNISFGERHISQKIAGMSLENNVIGSFTARRDSSFSFQVTKVTEIRLVVNKSDATSISGPRNIGDTGFVPNVLFSDIGGLQTQITELKMYSDVLLRNPKKYKMSGLAPPTGILLHGPPGTGKTMLINAFVTEARVKYFSLQITNFDNRNESAQKIFNLFKHAKEQCPAIIIMDEIDLICPRRESLKFDKDKHVSLLISNLMDNVTLFNKQSSEYVIFIAATSSVESIDPSLRRTGRLECEVEITIPSAVDRIDIFNKALKDINNSLTSSEVLTIAECAHGYVGADIVAVCREAARLALRESINGGDKQEKMFSLNRHHIDCSMKRIPPSAIRELVVQVPKVLWSDIGGNDDIKKKLKQTVEWPLKHPDAFKRLGIDPPGGVLLYGPPGCSKTLTAKALATESGLNFISIKGPELYSKYVGDSEKAIRRIFSKARSASPSIIFIDELDSLAIERSGNSSGGANVSDRILATLLTEMDGVEKHSDVIVVAATNRPDKIDKALLRPGRIDRIVHVPLPNSSTRQDIFRLHFQKIPISPEVDIDWLVQKTDMYSGAEICAVCREAAIAALERDMETNMLIKCDFEIAIDAVPPQTTKEISQMHLDYSKSLQSHIEG